MKWMRPYNLKRGAECPDCKTTDCLSKHGVEVTGDMNRCCKMRQKTYNREERIAKRNYTAAQKDMMRNYGKKRRERMKMTPEQLARHKQLELYRAQRALLKIWGWTDMGGKL